MPSHRPSFISSLSCIVFVVLSSTSSVAAEASKSNAIPKLATFDITNLIRFDDAAGAEARRDKLIHFIWPDGLPTTRPTVTDVAKDCPELSALEPELVDHVRRFDVDVSGFDFHSLVYVAWP